MRKRIVLAMVLVMTSSQLRIAARQSQRPAGETAKVDIVEVIGCLAEQSKDTWFVTNATEPVVSRVPYTNEASIKAAEAKPLGTLRFGLIAISVFNPDAHRGHRVTVKGLLIKDPKGDRLNVTSLQTASATCP